MAPSLALSLLALERMVTLPFTIFTLVPEVDAPPPVLVPAELVIWAYFEETQPVSPLYCTLNHTTPRLSVEALPRKVTVVPLAMVPRALLSLLALERRVTLPLTIFT